MESSGKAIRSSSANTTVAPLPSFNLINQNQFSVTGWIDNSECTQLDCDILMMDDLKENAQVNSIIIGNLESFDHVEYAEAFSFDSKIQDDSIDRIDYFLSFASGAIAGIIDILFVGEFSLARAKQFGEKDVENIVFKTAHHFGYKGDDLKDAIAHLEKRFRFAADSKVNEYGGAKQHHLRDFSHHFSIFGLLCSIITQFTGKIIGTNTQGAILIEDVSGSQFIGRNIPEKILFGTVNWFFHVVSDMAGSSTAIGNGTGIPGPVVSLMKEISALPIFRNRRIGENEFYVWVAKLFNGTLAAKRDENGKIVEPMPFDLRMEIGFIHEGSKQAIPILINEAIVRSFFLVRRIVNEIRQKDIRTIHDIHKIERDKVLPYNNPIIRRMCTVSTGTFCAIDVADAAIRKFKGKHGGFLLRVNFVGLGRFVFVCGAELRALLQERRAECGENEMPAKKGLKIGSVTIEPELVAQVIKMAAAIWIFAD